MGRVSMDELWKARGPVCTTWWPREEHTSCQRLQHRTLDVERPEGRLTSESDAHGVLGTLVSPFAKVAVVGSREKSL
jgi:hypothetical protein